jgi:uncharacterized membrane protein YkvA (DUF1232 family)
MKIIESLKVKAKSMKKQLSAVYYAYQDIRVGWLPKLLIGVAITYALSPIDLIPDFIPVLGYLDDLIIIPAVLGLAIKLIPEEVMEEAKKRAEEEPIKLKKNWTFGIIFIAIWAIVLIIIIKAIIGIGK